MAAKKRGVAKRPYPAHTYDPAMNSLLLIIENSGVPIKEICDKCGVSPSTIRAWRKGKTRRPQGVTMDFVARTIGYGRQWSKTK